MNDMFVTTTKPAIKNVVKKEYLCFSITIFYETIHKNVTKYFRVLSCVVCDIIENYVCVDYLAFQSNKLSFIYLD